MNLPIIIRPKTEQDKNFITKSYLGCQRILNKNLTNTIFYDIYNPLAHLLFDQTEILIAANQEDPWQIFAFLSFSNQEDPIIHFAYTKSIYRNFGLMRSLAKKLNLQAQPLKISHQSNQIDQNRLKMSIKYDPTWFTNLSKEK